MLGLRKEEEGPFLPTLIFCQLADTQSTIAVRISLYKGHFSLN